MLIDKDLCIVDERERKSDKRKKRILNYGRRVLRERHRRVVIGICEAGVGL